MKKTILITLVNILLSGTLVFSQIQEKNILRNIELLGKTLYEYDQACWIATDSLQSKNPSTALLETFSAHKENDLWKVGFGRLEKDGEHFQLIYEAILNSSNKQVTVVTYSPPIINTDFYFHAAKAYLAAYHEFENQSQSYNYSIIKKDDDNLYVYFYPAQTSNVYYYLGGDIRFTFNISANKITEKYNLHKSIIKMPYLNKGNDNAVATFSNAIITETPVETDILYVLSRGFKSSHYVGIGDWIYIIDENGIIKSIISREDLN